MKVIRKTYLQSDSPVYDLKISENHNYEITRSNITVHNSGKGFAVQHFMEKDKFKIYDVDYWKQAILKLKHLHDKYPELRNLDLRNPEHVFRIHQFVKDKKIEEKTLNLFMHERLTGSKHLPNVIFDITGKKITDISDVIPALLTIGYTPENIHLVWVLSDYKIALKNNSKRDRVVPPEVLLQTHEGAAKTMFQVLKGDVPLGLDGSINVILNNPEHTIAYGNAKSFVVKDFKYINVKKSGQPINKMQLFYSDLFAWIWQNIPVTDKTRHIIDEIETGIKYYHG